MSNITPEVAAQLAEQKKNCIFCKIIAGQVQGKKVYDDNLMEGILDINPCTKGHVLMMPKEHYPIMPFLPPDTFRHIFCRMPRLIKALKDAMLATGANILIANGAVAGQQSPHFLIHLIPREAGDNLDKFAFETKKTTEDERYQNTVKMLANNLPILMNNHFQNNPAKWHNGNIQTPDYLKQLEPLKLYQDERTFVIIPETPSCNGHVQIFSTELEKDFENLCEESATHLFYTASYAATAVFEGLGAQGSNIIIKTGTSNDNPEGKFSIHILPRFPDDAIDVICPPMRNKPDLDQIQKKVKDQFFKVEYTEEKKEYEVIDLDKQCPEVIGSRKQTEKKDEITDAIDRIRNN